MPFVRQLSIGLFLLGASIASAADSPTFESTIRPIFVTHCTRCHGDESQKAELSLDTAAGLQRGGESGEPLLLKTLDENYLYELIASGEMPPEEDKRLSAVELSAVKRWLKAGAKFENNPVDTAATFDQHDVLPILHRRCTCCHGAVYQEGGLDLRSRIAMLEGGGSGPALLLGNSKQSRMVERIVERLCPPAEDIGEAGIEPMTSDELFILTEWIAADAPETKIAADVAMTAGDPLVSDEERQFWSFQPPKKVALPTALNRKLPRTSIDSFLLERLEAKQLSFSVEADRSRLLRRVTFNLTGLPPSADEVSEFLQDEKPDAYERLVERLLASPRYGERWGRFWLDLAGYADSEGKRSADMIRPFAYRYRDYVIQAFNADRPYNEFLLEQLAGDELVDYAKADGLTPDAIEKLVATGFLRMAPDGTSADPVNRLSDRFEVIADEIDVLGRGIMGLTLQCARCHSHKYDPIPQRDYYRLIAVFKGAYDEYEWLTPQPFGNQWKNAKQRFLDVVMPDELQALEAHNAPIQASVESLQAALKKETNKTASAKLKKAIADQQASLRAKPRIRALWDRGNPSPTYIYQRGVETQPSRLVGPGVPSVLTDGKTPFDVVPPQHSSPKTGRRLALARWLTQPDHPLTARVIVNRIWKQHFGTGIVKSVDNFGKLGTPPSHPELLDWLAIEFIESGWSIKQLHRLMVTSAAYRQSSLVTEEHKRLDPENRLVSRMPMRRLDAEQLRDSLLYVTGDLAEQPFGEPDQVDVRKDGLVTSKASQRGRRRSVYVRQRRKEMPTVLETFDLPQMNPNCTSRQDSTIVSQPLYLLNNKMVHDLSRRLADRLKAEAGSDAEAQVDAIYLLALGRPATENEHIAGLEALKQLTQQWQSLASDDKPPVDLALADLCHALLNSAAFLYVD
jgi:Protein of unknown function (DUF1553)/Protein of unknown function (DUF1549)/Planctomycete cytochrome C